MAKQRYTVRGEGEYEDKEFIYAETAEKAAEAFADKYIPRKRLERADVHVLVLTPLKQKLWFGVSRVCYITSTSLDDDEEKFPITSMRSKERHLKVRCPHCEAKPEERCRRPSGKSLTDVHSKRISASIGYMP